MEQPNNATQISQPQQEAVVKREPKSTITFRKDLSQIINQIFKERDALEVTPRNADEVELLVQRLELKLARLKKIAELNAIEQQLEGATKLDKLMDRAIQTAVKHPARTKDVNTVCSTLRKEMTALKTSIARARKQRDTTERNFNF